MVLLLKILIIKLIDKYTFIKIILLMAIQMRLLVWVMLSLRIKQSTIRNVIEKGKVKFMRLRLLWRRMRISRWF
jgi:hypothetical protein